MAWPGAGRSEIPGAASGEYRPLPDPQLARLGGRLVVAVFLMLSAGCVAQPETAANHPGGHRGAGLCGDGAADRLEPGSGGGSAPAHIMRLRLYVSLTTTFDQMLELFQRIVAPLRHVGANPAQIALGLALAIRFIPELKRIYLEVREAQHARGLGNNPLAVSVPLVIRALRVADETAEALDARGYDSVEAGQQARTRPQRHA
ncbi:energy-coupling factor transporter transmembrane component T [Arthrobacter sp. JCM 19049]|uniref:energy-coupling factor transporter transmembrane component T n=1 Tax=Arthrobacter sp. JCM 19049 TaxID=1460643 RepID=UPI0027952537|nr:energy-coupling factor transporter transmembrane component T [Arthrobacter sp. JCM 19049]